MVLWHKQIFSDRVWNRSFLFLIRSFLFLKNVLKAVSGPDNLIILENIQISLDFTWILWPPTSRRERFPHLVLVAALNASLSMADEIQVRALIATQMNYKSAPPQQPVLIRYMVAVYDHVNGLCVGFNCCLLEDFDGVGVEFQEFRLIRVW